MGHAHMPTFNTPRLVLVDFHAPMDGEAVPCSRCAGSGDGPVDDSTCLDCAGRGEIDVVDLVDDRTFDDDAFDRERDEKAFEVAA